jgi:eukaryotic-like serine/threonine-protein kinase
VVKHQEERLPAGSEVGRFVVERELGAGGMGVVYEARDPDLDRRVALKLLRGGRGRAELSDRLLREAQALAQLSHPNVVTIYEVGVHDDEIFLAMEYLDGGTLDDRMSRGPIPWREAVELFLQAGRGLAAAHEKSIIHRDFKPANVMIDSAGRIRVTDFGLARLVDGGSMVSALSSASRPASASLAVTTTAGQPGDGGFSTPTPTPGPGRLAAPLTQGGAVVGTPRYMALEQHLGAPASEASDQYSFCLSLWEALYGAFPFAGADSLFGLEIAKGRGRPVRPAGAPRIPGWLVRIVERGLAPAASARHPSMRALLAALERTPIRRRRLAIGVASVAALAIAVGVGVGVETGGEDLTAACDRAGEPVAAIWNRAARQAVSSAFAAAPAYVAGDADRTIGGLDDFAAALAQARVESCRATRVRGEQSAALLDRRTICLDAETAVLGAVVERLSSVGGNKEHAIDLVVAMPSANACSAAALARARPLPADPRVPAALAAYASALAAGWLSQDAASMRLSEEAVALARAIGEPWLRGRALSLHGMNLIDKDGPAARKLLEEALADAVLAGDPVLEAETATRLLQAASSEGHSERILALLPLVRAAIQRAKADPPVVARALSAIAGALGRLHRYDEHQATCETIAALPGISDADDRAARCRCDAAFQARRPEIAPLCEAYVRLAEVRYGAQHRYTGQALQLLSIGLSRRGDHEAAVAAASRAVAVARASYGDQNRETARALANLATAQQLQESYAASLATAREALAIFEALPGDTDISIAIVETTMSDDAMELGDTTAARRHADDALVRAGQALGPAHSELAIYHIRRGQAYQASPPDQATALAAFQQAASIAEAADGPDSLVLSYAQHGAAECLAALDRPAEALPLAERSVAIQTVREKSPFNLATGHLLLSDVLHALGKRDRAIAEAMEGRRLMLEIGAKDEVAKLDGKLAQWRRGR